MATEYPDLTGLMNQGWTLEQAQKYWDMTQANDLVGMQSMLQGPGEPMSTQHQPGGLRGWASENIDWIVRAALAVMGGGAAAGAMGYGPAAAGAAGAAEGAGAAGAAGAG